MDDYTRKFNAAEDRDEQIHHVLTSVYEALKEKGYDPVNQIVGYILSEDPTYITNHNGARTLICKIDRDEAAADPGEAVSGYLTDSLYKREENRSVFLSFCRFRKPFRRRFDRSCFLWYTTSRFL